MKRLPFFLPLALVFTLASVEAQMPVLGPVFAVEPPDQICSASTVRAVALTGGDVLVAWLDDGIRARIFAPDGTPRGPSLSILSEATGAILQLDVDRVGDDRVVFVWSDATSAALLGRILDLSSEELGPELFLDDDSFNLAVDGRPDGSFVAVWIETGGIVRGRRFSIDGEILMEHSFPFPFDFGTTSLSYDHLDVTVDDAGRVVVASAFMANVLVGSETRAVALQISQSDGSEGPLHILQQDSTRPFSRNLRDPAVTTARGGRLLAVWEDRTTEETPRVAAWSQGEISRIDDGSAAVSRQRPQMALSPLGDLLVTWAERRSGIPGFRGVGRFVSPGGRPVGPPFILTEPSSLPNLKTAAARTTGRSLLVFWSSLFSNAACDPDPLLAGRLIEQPPVLMLNDQRFAVSVEWRDPRSGNAGRGTAVPLTDDTGAFWFFDEENLELMVKVLDARPVNGHFWVFFGSLTDVEFELTVTDLATGAEHTYTNPPFEMASRADTTAFDGAP